MHCLKIPLFPMGVLATGLRMLDPPLSPPLIVAEFSRRMCLKVKGKRVFSSLIHSVAIVLCS